MEIFEEKSLALSENNLPFTAFINYGYSEVKYHWHYFFEILYVYKGSGVVTISSESYNFSDGDFFIIHSNEVHHVQKGKWEILAIQFKPSILDSTYDDLYESQYFISFLQKKLIYSRHIHLEECDDIIIKLLLEMISEFSLKEKGYELNMKGNILKIFACLIRREYILLPDASQVSSAKISQLKNVINYVQEHYCEKITNEMAAKISLMSYHHFCRTFKKVTGKTFLEYVHYVRLCEAEKLLSLTNKSISEIALETGFSSCSHFSRIFKKIKGISPISYRKAQSCKN